MKRLFLPAAALLLAAGAARAEGPVAPPTGPDPMEEVREASLRISKALKENEEALTKLARGEKADPKPVDLSLPAKEAAKPSVPPSGSPPPSGGEGGTSESESLRKTSEQGKVVVDGINKILETAAKMGCERKSSEGSGAPCPEGKDPKDSQGNSKKDQEGKKDPLKDNKPENGGKPDSPDKPKNNNDTKGAVPPDPPKKSPPPKNLLGVFSAKLPDKVREAIENGDFDQIPERYRDLIREWTKALSEQDRKDTGGDAGEGR